MDLSCAIWHIYIRSILRLPQKLNYQKGQYTSKHPFPFAFVLPGLSEHTKRQT